MAKWFPEGRFHPLKFPLGGRFQAGDDLEHYIGTIGDHTSRDCHPHNLFNVDQCLPIGAWIAISASKIVDLTSRNCDLSLHR